MKQYLAVSSLTAIVILGLGGCSSMSSVSSAASLYSKLGGSSSVSSLASNFVGSSLKDPRLAELTAGKSTDASAATSKVSEQLCSMLGGGCKAPLTDSQVNSAASKVSPAQASAISDNFASSLNKVVSDPSVRQLVTSSVGSKLPGILGGVL